MKNSSGYLIEYLDYTWNIFITNVEIEIDDWNWLEHKRIVNILFEKIKEMKKSIPNYNLNYFEIKASYKYDNLNFPIPEIAKNIYTLFINPDFMHSRTIILDGFEFVSSHKFTKLIDLLSGWENIIFRNCIIYTDKDLMLKEDFGLDYGILIKLQNWIYSRWSDFKSNKVLIF